MTILDILQKQFLEICIDLQILFIALKYTRNRPTKQKRIPRIIPIIRIGLRYRLECQMYGLLNSLLLIDHWKDTL